MQLTGPSIRRQAAWRPHEPEAASGHSPYQQRAQELPPPTIGRHQMQKKSQSCSLQTQIIDQKAIPFPETNLALVLPTSRPIQASGYPSLCVRNPPTTGSNLTPALESLDPVTRLQDLLCLPGVWKKPQDHPCTKLSGRLKDKSSKATDINNKHVKNTETI